MTCRVLLEIVRIKGISVRETPNKSANSRQLSVNKDEEAETR